MISDMAKKMMRIIVILLLLLIAASIAYYRSLAFLPFAYGALLGSSLSLLKVVMLDRAVASVITQDKEKAGNRLLAQHFIRYLLTGAVLIIAALVPFINIWGTAAGILSMQVAVFFIKQTQPAAGSTTTE